MSFLFCFKEISSPSVGSAGNRRKMQERGFGNKEEEKNNGKRQKISPCLAEMEKGNWSFESGEPGGGACRWSVDGELLEQLLQYM